MKYSLELKNITKTFGNLVANDNITIKVREGSIHSIVGENGAGKSTLMNIVYGLLKPDKGEIIFDGKQVSFSSPIGSISSGIGMIHQHFMLIPTMTVLDNIILGYEIGNIKLNRKKAKEDLKPLFAGMGLNIDICQSKLGELSVGVQQKIEIIKALYRKAKLIVLDEPTAVLTPQEIKDFFVLLNKLKKEGKTIIFISHKLNEIIEISDDITIMRSGKVVGCVKKEEVNEDTLAELMVGRELVEQKIEYKENINKNVIEVKNICTELKLGSRPLNNLSFNVKKGEVFGIAGVAGNGQTELINILVGTQSPKSGEVFILGQNVTNIPIRKRPNPFAYVPEDRQIDGLVMPFSISENLVLGKLNYEKFTKSKIFLNFKSINENAKENVENYSIKISSSIHDPVKSLSGGNQQKVIVARELNDDPEIILVVNPTRGVDIGAIEYIHSCLIKQRKLGKTIILVSNELSEIMALSDRIGIIHDGEIVKVLNNNNLSKEQIGHYMLNGNHDNKNVVKEEIE